MGKPVRVWEVVYALLPPEGFVDQRVAVVKQLFRAIDKDGAKRKFRHMVEFEGLSIDSRFYVMEVSPQRLKPFRGQI